MKPQIVNLWGETEDPFEKAIERYGIWPTTVWDCDLSDPYTRKLKKLVGDDGSARPDVFMSGGGVYGGKVKTTIFNPAVAAWLLNLYAEPPGLVFDPFAGGGTRAIMAGARGMDYIGLELRQVEVDATNTRIHAAGFSEGVCVRQGDALNPPNLGRKADMLLTCPPYWNLEQYEGGPTDLSMAPSYDAFVAMLGVAVSKTRAVLRPGALSCWVVGLHRDKDGELLPIHHDLVREHQRAGFRFKEEVVLAQRNTGAIQRVGNFERGDRRLVRAHEYVVIFEA